MNKQEVIYCDFCTKVYEKEGNFICHMASEHADRVRIKPEYEHYLVEKA